MTESETTEPCPICGAKLIRVKLFNREWLECENSVMEFFDGMRRGDEEKFYAGPTHFTPLPGPGARATPGERESR